MRGIRFFAVLTAGLLALAAACSPAASPTAGAPTSTTQTQATATTTAATSTTGAAATATKPATTATVVLGTPTAAALGTATKAAGTATAGGVARLFALVNPNKITEIDPATDQVVKTWTIEIPGDGRWAYNDENHHFDGTNMWLLTRNSNGDANDLGVMVLNLNTMQVEKWTKVGSGNFNSFAGRATTDGLFPVALRDLGQVAVFDTKTFNLIKTYDVPLDVDATGKLLYKKDFPNPADTTGRGAVVCDMDITTINGKEVGVYPTQGTEKVIAIDPHDGSYVAYASIAKGSKGNMLTTSATNGYIWAQENGTNSQAVIDPKTMQVLAHVPTGKQPAFNAFSPDGKITYINGGDTVTTVVDAITFKVLATVQVGAGAGQSAANPNGKVVYTHSSGELKIAVIDTANWQVTKSITLPGAPSGMFFHNVAR